FLPGGTTQCHLARGGRTRGGRGSTRGGGGLVPRGRGSAGVVEIDVERPVARGLRRVGLVVEREIVVDQLVGGVERRVVGLGREIAGSGGGCGRGARSRRRRGAAHLGGNVGGGGLVEHRDPAAQHAQRLGVALLVRSHRRAQPDLHCLRVLAVLGVRLA